MDISVIIPAHNEGAYIEDTIRSYHTQRIPHELIVVANACSDNTANLANDLGAIVIETNEKGVSLARNLGVRNSSGNILVFNDADTIVAHDYLTAIAYVTQNGVDFGTARAVADERRLVSFLYSLMLDIGANLFEESLGNVFVKREFFEKVGGFDESLSSGEDNQFCLDLKAQGANYGYLKDTFIVPSSRKASVKQLIKDPLSYCYSRLKK